jgi:16S rRNA (uracil1498-N3)-methyltransferase
VHYLKNVMRRQQGDFIRLFNGRHGEWAAKIVTLGRSEAVLEIGICLRPQPVVHRRLHLLFPLLKKNRLDIVIEKSVELGVDFLVPVLTDHTDVRDINQERLVAQIKEAAEQCERLVIPAIHDLRPLASWLHDWPRQIKILAAIERVDLPTLAQAQKKIAPTDDIALLIGPVGGFSQSEKDLLLQQDFVIPVSLGDHILRSETAVIAMLSYLMLDHKG